MKTATTRLPAALLLSASLWAAGCGGGGDEKNLSTLAPDDPAKLQAAQAEAAQAAARAKKAEAAKLKGAIKVEEP